MCKIIQLILLFSPFFLIGQGVGIGTSLPRASLHIKSQDPLTIFEPAHPLILQGNAGDTVFMLSEDGQIFLNNDISDFATLNIRKDATLSQPHILLEQEHPGALNTIDFVNADIGRIFWDASNLAVNGESYMGLFVPGVGYQLYAKSNGHVGINNGSPQEILDVNGELSISNSLHFNNSLGQPNQVVMSEGNNPTKYGNLNQGYLSPGSYASSIGVQFSTINRYEPIVNIPGQILTDTSLVVGNYGLTLTPFDFQCQLLCPDSEVDIIVKAVHSFGYPDIVLVKRRAKLQYNKATTLNGNFSALIQPNFSFPNAGDYRYEVGAVLLAGSKVTALPPTSSPSRGSIHIYPQN